MSQYLPAQLRRCGSFVARTLGALGGSVESTAVAGNGGRTNEGGETLVSTAGTGEPDPRPPHR